MSRFSQAVVTAVRQDTPSAKVISIDCPDFKNADFRPGQYITVRFELDDRDQRRSYSVCNLPTDGKFNIGVKQLENGVVSSHINEKLSAGHSIEVMAPDGNFVIRESADPVHHIFFAAGSGITPVMSMIEHVVAQGRDTATLFYGNRSAGDSMFKAQLEEFNNSSNLNVVNIYSDGSGASALERGRIDFSKTLELLRTFVNTDLPKVNYICGPSGMMTAVENALADNGVAESDIVKEHFVNPDQNVGDKHEDHDEPVGDFTGMAKIKVTLDGEEHSLELATNGKVIVDAVLAAGMDAPFSCKGGVCTTCKAELLSGKVNMDSNYALTDSELEEGYILTCQAHPCTPEIEITYDI